MGHLHLGGQWVRVEFPEIPTDTHRGLFTPAVLMGLWWHLLVVFPCTCPGARDSVHASCAWSAQPLSPFLKIRVVFLFWCLDSWRAHGQGELGLNSVVFWMPGTLVICICVTFKPSLSDGRKHRLTM